MRQPPASHGGLSYSAAVSQDEQALILLTYLLGLAVTFKLVHTLQQLSDNAILLLLVGQGGNIAWQCIWATLEAGPVAAYKS